MAWCRIWYIRTLIGCIYLRRESTISGTLASPGAETPRSSLSRIRQRDVATAGTKKSVRFALAGDDAKLETPSPSSSLDSTILGHSLPSELNIIKKPLSNQNAKVNSSSSPVLQGSPPRRRIIADPPFVDTTVNFLLNNENNPIMPNKCPIEQGMFDDCWLLSTALSFWRSPAIKNQFSKQISKFCYIIRLWTISCEWDSYRIHRSSFPAKGGTVAHSAFADYVRYIEGAFLNYQGSDALAKNVGDPVESNVWLTGGFAERCQFGKSEVGDRRIFVLLSDKNLFATVQKSGERERHSFAVVQWEKLPYGSGNRFLIIDSNVQEGEETASEASTPKNPTYTIGNLNLNNMTFPNFRSSTSFTSTTAPANSRRLLRQNAIRQSEAGSDSVDNPSEAIGQLTGWYTPQRLMSTFDSCTICRPLIHEDPEEIKSRIVQMMSSWIPELNSGGSRRNLENFAINPQFVFKLRLVGSPNVTGTAPTASSRWSRIDGQTPWLWVSLSQPYRFDKTGYCHMAFHVYRLPASKLEAGQGPLKSSFFLHTAELFSSAPYANYSIASKSYSDSNIPQSPATIPRFDSSLHREAVDIEKESSPVVYLLVVPATYFPVKSRTEFLLRVFSEIGELTFHSAWNFDSKTINVPWSLFNPEVVDYTAEQHDEEVVTPRRNSSASGGTRK